MKFLPLRDRFEPEKVIQLYNLECGDNSHAQQTAYGLLNEKHTSV